MSSRLSVVIFFLFSLIIPNLSNSNILNITSNASFAQPDFSNDLGDPNDYISASLINTGGKNLSPDPNEQIDLYSGTLRLHYVDFSVEVAPGLKMEVKRTYNSGVYNRGSFDTPGRYNLNNNILPSWNYGVTYILMPTKGVCREDGNKCDPVLVKDDGISEQLHAQINKSNWFRTKSHYELDANTWIMYDRKGFKYSFGYTLQARGATRYYLTKVTTPDGHWVQYDYNGIYIAKITSSDPSKKIDIIINDFILFKNYHYRRPEKVLFNGTEVISYEHTWLNHMGDSVYQLFTGMLGLSRVLKANGERLEYSYDQYYIRTKHIPEGQDCIAWQIGKINYFNGEQTQYKYKLDNEMLYSTNATGLRLLERSHTDKSNDSNNGVWTFSESLTTLDGVKAKYVNVDGPYHSERTLFSHNQDEFVWRAGQPLEHIVYADKSGTKELQRESYIWDKYQFTNKPYYTSSAFTTVNKDLLGYKARLLSKTITRHASNGVDSYNMTQSNFDEYDNPQKIIQTSSNGEAREITKEFINYSEPHIIGLLKTLNVNNQNVEKYKYDAKGNVIQATKLGVDNFYTYDKGLLSSSTDANGSTNFYKNYIGTQPSFIHYADGTKKSQIVNPDNTIQSIINTRGNTTSYEYNILGQLTKEIPALGESINYAYGANTKEMQNGAYNSHEEYNVYNKLLFKIENNSRIFNYDYDALGRKIFESYPGDNTGNKPNNLGHYYQYDSLSRIVADCYPNQDSDCTMFNYLANNTINIIKPNGEYRTVTYRSYGVPDNGKIVKIKEDSRETIIDRNDLDYITSVTQGKITKNYTYDKNYNISKYQEPETGTAEYKYDAVGNLLEKNQNGEVTKYEYHPKNYKLLKASYSDNSGNVSYNYDANGNLLKAVKGGVVQEYEYNQVDKLISETLKYDGNVFDIKYTYNNLNDLASITYPDKSVVDYNPNEYGLPTKVGSYVNNISYHANNHWAGLSLGNGISAVAALDSRNRINSYKYGGLNLDYNFDSNNNLLNLALFDSASIDFNYKLNFGYDKLGRITSAQGPWGINSYEYDINDNLTSIYNVAGVNNNSYINKNLNLSLNYDSKNRLSFINKAKGYNLNAFSYDNHGNITADNSGKYFYGLDGNLQASYGSENISYEYDSNQNRIAKTTSKLFSKTNIITFYNQAGQALFEYDASNERASKYIYFNGHKIAVTEKNLGKNKTDQTNYFYNDAVGSPVAMADSQGKTLWREVYQPHGIRVVNDQNSKKTNKHWFAGKEVDSTNLSYFGARYYNALTGRFMSPDPVAMDPEDPSTFNRYGYAANNPYKYVDPDGRWAFLIVFAIDFGVSWGIHLAGISVVSAMGIVAIDNYLNSYHDSNTESNHEKSGASDDNKDKKLKAPGKPTEDDGYIPPKRWNGEMVNDPNGRGYGWPDKKGRIWIPTGEAGSLPGTRGPAHGGPHWDVQNPNGKKPYDNVFPGGKKR